MSKKMQSLTTRREEPQDTHDRVARPQPAANACMRIKLDHLRKFDALTENQQKFFTLYKQGSYFTGLFGSAGVGKTFLSMYRAIEEVLDKSNQYKQVVVVRSAVPGRSQGFLPGTLEEKQELYELPYKEICTTLFDRPDAWAQLKEQGHARFMSTTAIRGISIDDSIVIVDECQNMNWTELSSVITRVGNRTKIIFCGDWKQNELTTNRHDQSGLLDFMKVAKSMSEYSEVMFTPQDIVRSNLVKSFILACEAHGL